MGRKLTACSIGSCLPTFIQKHFVRLSKSLGMDIAFPLSGTELALNYCKTHGIASTCRDTGSVQLRNDVTLDIINGLVPDYAVYLDYLRQGKWQNKFQVWEKMKGEYNCEYYEFFYAFLKVKYDMAAELSRHAPDILIVDSHDDMMTTTYRHRARRWNGFFGNIQFDDPSVDERFRAEFEFHRPCTAGESVAAMAGLYEHFKSRNPSLKLVYIHFPMLRQHAPKVIIERFLEFDTSAIADRIPAEDLIEITVPDNAAIPVANPESGITDWEHFEDDTYRYIAMKAANSIIERLAR